MITCKNFGEAFFCIVCLAVLKHIPCLLHYSCIHLYPNQSLASESSSKPLDRKSIGTRCIVLCPTRELANHIFTTCESLCRSTFCGIVCGCLSGGERRKSEKARIRKGLNIIIATPGRLLDHLQKTACLLESVSKLKWLVLDEADRLLDMGLGHQVEQAVQLIRGEALSWRVVCVSATVTGQIQELAQSISKDKTLKWKWARGTKDGSQGTATKNDTNSNNTLADSTPRQLK